jgi:hypothetical protein
MRGRAVISFMSLLVLATRQVASAEASNPQANSLRPAEVLARARQAVKAVRAMHTVRQSRSLCTGEWESWETWEEGDRYRYDRAEHTLVLNKDWGISYSKAAEIGLAAQRRADDMGMFGLPALLSLLDPEGPWSPSLGATLVIRSDVAVRRRKGKRQVEVQYTRMYSQVSSPSDKPYSVTTRVWVDTGTWLPVQSTILNQTLSGEVRGEFKTEYEFDRPVPKKVFSWPDILAGDAVIVGWEGLRELQEHDPIASQTFKGALAEVVVDVRGVERLPRDYLLITGSVKGADPQWLAAHLTLEEGPLRRSYSLAHVGYVLPGPWAGGGSFARQHYFMVFSPSGCGHYPGLADAPPTLIFRAWGSVLHPLLPPSGERTKYEEKIVAVELSLAPPEGAPVVHELQKQLAGR